MLNGFKQAFPNNAALFNGFPSFPFDAQAVPEAWRGRFGTGWSQQVINVYGVFQDTVRPILDEMCSGCHSGTAPMGGLSFAKDVSSTNIVGELVNMTAKSGGQFMRVLPGQRMQSWLYLKVSDTAKSAGCMGTCNTQSMPPTGQIELSAAQLEAVRTWSADGAVAPSTTP